MKLELDFDPQGIEWTVLADVFERAPLGKRDPQQLRRAFEKSFLTCFAFDRDKLVPGYQGKGVGRRVMQALLDRQKIEFILLTTTIGKEGFYRRLGLRHHKTAMALYRGAKQERGQACLEWLWRD